jgi:hypothetical protein
MENLSNYFQFIRSVKCYKAKLISIFIFLATGGVSCSNQLFPDSFIPLSSGDITKLLQQTLYSCILRSYQQDLTMK